jgi:phosphonate transport system substrate-binding protein
MKKRRYQTMRKPILKTLIVIVLLSMIVVLAACGKENNTAAAGQQTLRLAVTDMEGLEELQTDFGAFKTALETSLDMKIDFYPVSDRTAAVAALQANQVDFLLTGPAEYVILRSKNKVQPVIGMERPGYHSLVVVYKDSPIQTVEDLKGKKISMSDVGSTSGHLAPSKLLIDAGLDLQKDLEVIMLGNADLQALKSKDVDAWAGGWSYLQKFMDKEGLTIDDFRILIEGPQLPRDIFIASESLPKETVDLIREKMIEHEDELIAAILTSDANKKYKGATLKPVEDSEYDYVRGMYEAIGITDFNEFVGK